MDQISAQPPLPPSSLTSSAYFKIALSVTGFLLVLLVGFYVALYKYGAFWEKKPIPTPTPGQISHPTPSPTQKRILSAFKGVVEAVDVNSFRVKNEKGEIKEFEINEKTEYFIKKGDVKPQKIEKGGIGLIKVGKTIYVYVIQQSVGKTLATSILIVSP